MADNLGLNYHITVDMSEFEAAASQASDEVFKAHASQAKAIYEVAKARKQDADEIKEAKKAFLGYVALWQQRAGITRLEDRLIAPDGADVSGMTQKKYAELLKKVGAAEKSFAEDQAKSAKMVATLEL